MRRQVADRSATVAATPIRQCWRPLSLGAPKLNRVRYGSREFGDRSSAISIGSWIFPEFLTKRPDEDVRLLAEEQSELVNIS